MSKRTVAEIVGITFSLIALLFTTALTIAVYAQGMAIGLLPLVASSTVGLLEILASLGFLRRSALLIWLGTAPLVIISALFFFSSLGIYLPLALVILVCAIFATRRKHT